MFERKKKGVKKKKKNYVWYRFIAIFPTERTCSGEIHPLKCAAAPNSN